MSVAAEPLLDTLLEAWRLPLGRDYQAYRNHCQRVFHLTRAHRRQVSDADDHLIALACTYHDLAIWTHGTLDYLEPSCDLAEHALRQSGHENAAPVLRAMILSHHQLRPAGKPRDLVEAFRRADWTDVTLGTRRFDLPREFYAALRESFPNAGFHLRLLQLGSKHGLRHPFKPLPMFRW